MRLAKHTPEETSGNNAELVAINFNEPEWKSLLDAKRTDRTFVGAEVTAQTSLLTAKETAQRHDALLQKEEARVTTQTTTNSTTVSTLEGELSTLQSDELTPQKQTVDTAYKNFTSKTAEAGLRQNDGTKSEMDAALCEAIGKDPDLLVKGDSREPKNIRKILGAVFIWTFGALASIVLSLAFGEWTGLMSIGDFEDGVITIKTVLCFAFGFAAVLGIGWGLENTVKSYYEPNDKLRAHKMPVVIASVIALVVCMGAEIVISGHGLYLINQETIVEMARMTGQKMTAVPYPLFFLAATIGALPFFIGKVMWASNHASETFLKVKGEETRKGEEQDVRTKISQYLGGNTPTATAARDAVRLGAEYQIELGKLQVLQTKEAHLKAEIEKLRKPVAFDPAVKAQLAALRNDFQQAYDKLTQLLGGDEKSQP